MAKALDSKLRRTYGMRMTIAQIVAELNGGGTIDDVKREVHRLVDEFHLVVGPDQSISIHFAIGIVERLRQRSEKENKDQRQKRLKAARKQREARDAQLALARVAR